MSLSHFDEKSGIIACNTTWGRWWQTVSEVFIDVNVPQGTRAKDCKIDIQSKYIACKVKNEIIFQGDLFSNVIVDDSTWTLEEQKKISILLTKVEKFTLNNLWESLLSDEYAPDAWTREEMLKKLDLEKFQIENGSGDGDDLNNNENVDAASVCSKSDNEDEEEESQQNVEQGSEVSSPPQSPAGSIDAGHSEDEVHISEHEDSHHGSDNEDERIEKESVGSREESEAEGDKEEKDVNDSDHEDSVPEINIQSEDEDNEEKGNSDVDDMNESSEIVEEKNDEGKEEGMDVSGEGDIAAESDKVLPHPNDSDNEAEERDVGEKNVEMADANAEPAEGTSGYGDLIANIFGDSDADDSDASEGESTPKKKKGKARRKLQVASDSEEEGEKSEADAEHDDSEVGKKDNEDEQEPVNEDEEDNEVSGEVQASSKETASQNKKVSHAISDDDSDEGISKGREDFISDFDLMMQKKKESSRRRKRRDVDIINDSDDLIADIISQMRQAADEDRALNKVKKTATKKLRILPLVMSQLKKQDLKMAFLDQGVLNVMADWLAPLPDRSLPNLQIREGMIKQLDEFPTIDQSLLKSSGVGRALMYLYKHPKETKENRDRAYKLITEWSRPIFNVTTNYHSLTKEEREKRDYEHIPKKRKVRDHNEEKESPEKKDIEKALEEGDRKLRPGDKGWVGRARVPAPSTKDYVYRPRWNVEIECGRSSSKKSPNRFEKHMRSLQEKKKLSKCQRAVTISIEGRKMAI